MRRPKNISEIRKEPVIIKFFRDFINNKKQGSSFSRRPFLSIAKHKDYRWDFPSIWKTKLETTELYRSECSENILANSLALSDIEDNTSRSLNRRGILKNL